LLRASFSSCFTGASGVRFVRAKFEFSSCKPCFHFVNTIAMTIGFTEFVAGSWSLQFRCPFTLTAAAASAASKWVERSVTCVREPPHDRRTPALLGFPCASRVRQVRI